MPDYSDPKIGFLPDGTPDPNSPFYGTPVSEDYQVHPDLWQPYDPAMRNRYGADDFIPANEAYLAGARGRLQNAQAAELLAARRMFNRAGRVAERQSAVRRGEIAHNVIGSSRAGDALAVRRATMAGGRAMTGSAGQAINEAGKARLAAAGGVMSAQGRGAEYEKALFEDYMQRMAALQAYKDRTEAADRAQRSAESAATQQITGSILSAMGGTAAGMSGMAASYRSQGDQPANPDARDAVGNTGFYADAPGGYVNNQGMSSGANYYNSAYDAYYGK